MIERPRVDPEELKRRARWRSIAIGLALGALVVVFYVLTIVKMGGAVFSMNY